MCDSITYHKERKGRKFNTKERKRRRGKKRRKKIENRTDYLKMKKKE